MHHQSAIHHYSFFTVYTIRSQINSRSLILGEKKIKNLNKELGIAEKTYKTRLDRDHAASIKPTDP